MAVFTDMRRRFRHIALPALAACVVAYFAYHTVQGDRGFFSLMRLSNEVDRAETALNTLRSERLALEHRVSLLDPRSLDLDMLEERVRVDLNRLRPDEIVIYRSHQF